MSANAPIRLIDPPGSRTYSFSKSSADVRQRLGDGKPSLALEKPVTVDEASERQLTEDAIHALQAAKVDFGDLRLGRELCRSVAMSDENLTDHCFSEINGVGIRALVKGFWGFAATTDLTSDGVRACALRAVEMARALAATAPTTAALKLERFAPEPVHKAVFHTPVGLCPFSCPTETIAAPLRAAAAAALQCQDIKRAHGFATAFGRRRLFASTEGSRILTTHTIVNIEQKIIAVANGTSGYRTLVAPAVAGGLEHFLEEDFAAHAPRYAEEARSKCFAKQPDPGRYTLILDGHNLALTMHESVGHPTELDRVLGYELSFAGGSFASLEKLGKFRYGSPIVNFTADNRVRYGAASQGFDDEGVECQSFPIIREGTLVGYGTNRETAHAIGLNRANGTCRADSCTNPPIVRIPNLFLEPGKDKLSLQQLITDTDDGILMLGRDSFSIDQMRYNFQFGADMSWRIRQGKIAEPLRDVIYQSITPEFWGSCDAICDESEWQMHGVFNCGKGQPSQTARMMHGAAPSRFRNVRVGY